ncbi:unnamed protein product [Rhizophagus irregularis]|nr:unnamed protein product [Rhizophagus irregularis]
MYTCPGSLTFRLFGSKVPVLWHFDSSVRRSQFFGISTLRFEGPGSLAFQLFGPGSFFDNFGALAFSSTFRF